MKIKLIIALSALLFCLPASGQDILYLKTGKKDTVKVEDITATDVVYKKFKNLDGPSYRLPKSEIVLIQYADGTVEMMGGGNATAEEEEDVYIPRKKREDDPAFIASLGDNMVGINLLNLVNGNINLHYEKIVSGGKVGLRGTVNFSVLKAKNDPEIIRYRREFTMGADVKFYPGGQGKVKYYIGPSIRFGLLGVYNNTYWDGIEQRYYNYPAEFNYFALFFNNGVTVNVTSNFYIDFQAAVGYGRFRYVNYVAGAQFARLFREVDGMGAINLGYRF